MVVWSPFEAKAHLGYSIFDLCVWGCFCQFGMCIWGCLFFVHLVGVFKNVVFLHLVCVWGYSFFASVICVFEDVSFCNFWVWLALANHPLRRFGTLLLWSTSQSTVFMSLSPTPPPVFGASVFCHQVFLEEAEYSSVQLNPAQSSSTLSPECNATFQYKATDTAIRTRCDACTHSHSHMHAPAMCHQRYEGYTFITLIYCKLVPVHFDWVIIIEVMSSYFIVR